jgi:hypothetical protein
VYHSLFFSFGCLLYLGAYLGSLIDIYIFFFVLFRLDCLMLENQHFSTRSQSSRYLRKTSLSVLSSQMRRGLISLTSALNGSANLSSQKVRFVSPILEASYSDFMSLYINNCVM